MSQLSEDVMARIEAHPQYRLLQRKRNALGWLLTCLVLLAYYGFIALVAFEKSWLAQPLGDGVTSIGVPLALGVIVLVIALTGLYVWRANNEYDRLTAEVLKGAGQ